MKTIYFVRHGESEANIGASVFQGEESPLTERGREQARFIAKRCTKLPIEVIIASPAVRARDTARYISEATGKPVETDATFTERILPPELIGVSRKDSKGEKVLKEWEHSFFEAGTRVGFGENFELLKMRAQKGLETLAARPEKNILVVTHGFFLRMTISCIMFGETLSIAEFERIIQTFRTSNTGLTLAEYRPQFAGAAALAPPMWEIRAWNDHAPLG